MYLPEPVFEISEVTLKTGRNKGKVVKRISLVLGNHVFKRNKKIANGKIIFSCNGCEKQGQYLSAVVGTEDEEADKYYLIRAPHITQHTCWVSSHHLAIKKAKEEMFEMVLKEPTRGLQEIYEVVRQWYTAEMDPNTKLLFIQDFPKFVDVKSSLLTRRRQMIPPDPKVMADIDVDLPVFLTKKGENVVKGEQVLSDGRRVILFTTNEHLKILARAHQILGDGTFRITPGLWCQTFIISAEVSSGVFVPVCFCLLPNKKKESYETMFSLLKEALETLGKELSAAYFMSDFELAIRNAFTGTFQGIEAKGCAFHYSKAVLSKVARSGFKGETTNNHSEGYNLRLGNKKNIGKHPNFYQWVETIKLELEISHDEKEQDRGARDEDQHSL